MDHIVFFVKCLDHVVSAVHFLDLTVYISEIFLLSAEIFLRMFHNEGDQANGNRQDQQRHNRHKRTDRKHHNENSYQSRHRSNKLRRALVQTLSESIYIICHTGEHLADRLRVKIIHRHPIDLFRNIFSQSVRRFL